MNHLKIDFASEHEKSQNILDQYDFKTLLLELNCNCQVIDETAARKQFYSELQSKVEDARAIFEANIDEIVNQAKKDREEPADELQDLPREVKEIIFSEQIFLDKNLNIYAACERVKKKLEAINWSCNYDLSGQLFDVKPIE